jgi:hypothetical protein
MADATALKAAVLAAQSRSIQLAARSEETISRAHAACLASRPGSRFALVRGEVEGHALVALVRRDASVVVDRRLLRRIALLQSLDERLATGAMARVGLDPLSALLTLIRACDSLQSVTMADSRVGLDVLNAFDVIPPPRPSG